MPELDDQSIMTQTTRDDILSPEKMLEDSLRKYGIVHPIVTKPGGEIICGKRRLETAQKIGLEQIPTHVMNPSTPLEELDIRLIENLGHREYSCLELTELLLQRKLLWEQQ